MKKRISRPYRFQYRGIASSAEHNAEHDLFTDSINELYGIFDYENGNFTLPASSVTMSGLRLDSFLLVGHNPDGTLKLPPMPNFTVNPSPNAVPMAGNDGKISVNWLPLGHNSGLNADTVDNFHASQVPAPNTIPVAGNDGKLNPAWLPAGSGGGDADTVDGFHASQTPAPNTIPASLSNGKLHVNWLPTGHGGGLDADTVDTFHASRTPTPNAIPVAGSDGKIDAGWLPITGSGGGSFSYYGRLTVGTSLPASGNNEGDLFYRTTDNKLFVFRNGSWSEINWLPFVQASPEWIAGRLRVQGGQLQVSPDGTNWHNCIPCVGASVIRIATVDNTSYTRLYWIAPGQTVVLDNVNHVPIVFAKDVNPVYNGYFVVSYNNNAAVDHVIGLRPNNIALSGGEMRHMHSAINPPTSLNVVVNSNASVFPLYLLTNSGSMDYGRFSVSIRNNNVMHGITLTQIVTGGFTALASTRATIPSSSYWFGTVFVHQSTPSQLTVPHVMLTRVA